MPMMNHAIVLAAGFGSRLRPLTESRPKCLTDVAGRSILMRTLEALARPNIERTTVVVGYLAQSIREEVKALGIRGIEFAENIHYAKSGTAHSFLCALRTVVPGQDILMIEGDVVFDPWLLSALCEPKEGNFTVVEPYRPPLSGSFVQMDERRVVTCWLPTSSQPPGFSPIGCFKTVNMTRLAGEAVNNAVLPCLNEWERRGPIREHFEHLMNRLIQNRELAIKGILTKNAPWVEIDDNSDLVEAERLFGS